MWIVGKYFEQALSNDSVPPRHGRLDIRVAGRDDAQFRIEYKEEARDGLEESHKRESSGRHPMEKAGGFSV
jgi:hypothetical protein